MSSDIYILDPCTSDEWLTFINTHPDAGIFHHPAWMNMLRDIYGYRMFAVCARDGKGIRAGIPFADVRSILTGRRWVSLPFSDYCHPLFPENDQPTIDGLVQFLKTKQGSETPKIEIRGDVDSSYQVHRTKHFVNHSLKLLPSETELFKVFDRQGAQRSVRLAEGAGVVVKECRSFEDFEVFYNLQVMTRRRLGVPAQPKSFFKGVWEYLLKPNLGFVLITFKDGEPIAGGVFFTFNKTVFYKYSASDIHYKKLHPNHAFIWRAMQRAIAEGYTTFDFGRSEKENDGLRRFKRGWGADEQELVYSTISDHPPNSGTSRLTGVAGVVIRNSPEFVCTLSGKILYKHFA